VPRSQTRRDPRTGHWLWAVPSETTIRRTLARLDAEALAAAIGAWLADRDHPGQHRRRRAVAFDGKTLRGASGTQGRQVHLLACMEHATRAVLAQRQVDGAPGEVPGFQLLVADLDLAGVVVTADALQTHAEAAEFLVGKQAHYLFTVKANQPTLLACCAAWPGIASPSWTAPRDRAHGRVELRTLKAVTVHHFGFPHATQVIQVTRKTRKLRTRRWRTVTIYAITSLTFAQASPARPSPPSGSSPDEPDITRERRSPGYLCRDRAIRRGSDDCEVIAYASPTPSSSKASASGQGDRMPRGADDRFGKSRAYPASSSTRCSTSTSRSSPA
jgi:hypothetical protein